MSSKLKNRIFIFFATVLAGVFIYILISKIDFDKTFKAFKEANHIWLIVSLVLGIYSYWLRAIRWNILLEPMGLKIKKSSAFWTIAFAYFMNLIIPRSGEIARATSLYKIERVPVEKSFATIVLERIVDLLFLVFFAILTLLFNAKTLFAFFNLSKSDSEEESSNLIYYILLGLVAIFVIIIFIFRKKITQSAIYQKLILKLIGFKEGLLSIFKLKQKVKFIVYSCGIWLCYFLMTYLVVFSFEATENLGIEHGFFLMIAGSLGMILPATGGLAYPYVMRIAFAAIFLSIGKTSAEGYEVGDYFGISLYLVQVLSMLVTGFISLYFIASKKIVDGKD